MCAKLIKIIEIIHFYVNFARTLTLFNGLNAKLSRNKKAARKRPYLHKKVKRGYCPTVNTELLLIVSIKLIGGRTTASNALPCVLAAIAPRAAPTAIVAIYLQKYASTIRCVLLSSYRLSNVEGSIENTQESVNSISLFSPLVKTNELRHFMHLRSKFTWNEKDVFIPSSSFSFNCCGCILKSSTAT